MRSWPGPGAHSPANALAEATGTRVALQARGLPVMPPLPVHGPGQARRRTPAGSPRPRLTTDLGRQVQEGRSARPVRRRQPRRSQPRRDPTTDRRRRDHPGDRSPTGPAPKAGSHFAGAARMGLPESSPKNSATHALSAQPTPGGPGVVPKEQRHLASSAQADIGGSGGRPPGRLSASGDGKVGVSPPNRGNPRAEGVGFEPTRSVTRSSNFQDCRHRPLGEPSWLAQLYASGERCAALAAERPGRAKASATRAASVR